MTPLTKTAYAAIRITDGREWIDTGTIEILPDMARDNAEKTNNYIPHYAKDNPVVRIAELEIREVTP